VPKLEELDNINKKIKNTNFNNSLFTIGFVTGASGRWQGKAWPPSYYANLAQKILKKYPECLIILLGGDLEEKTNHSILDQIRKENKSLLKRINNINTKESIRLFGAMFSIIDLVVTGDTLGLHLALSANCRVVVLVGPTSASELELYNHGTVLTPPDECKCYYKNSCEYTPSCMETIYPEFVLEKLEREILLLKK